MGLTQCRKCGTSFTGFMCPDCKRPIPLLGAMVVLVPVAIALILVAILIPDETIPYKSIKEGGISVYVFQSFQEAVLWPLGALLVLLAALCYGIVFKKKNPPDENQRSKTGNSRILNLVVKTVQFLLIGLLLLVFINVIFIAPSTEFRRIEISDERVVCQSLFQTRTLPINDIVEARFVHIDVTRSANAVTDYKMIIHTQSEEIHSITASVDRGSGDSGLFKEMMQSCVADINKRRKKKEADDDQYRPPHSSWRLVKSRPRLERMLPFSTW